jgi:hypothetical protein
MTLLRDNKLITVDTSEDKDNTIIAIKSLDYLLANEKYHDKAVSDKIYTLRWEENNRTFTSAPDHYIFRCSQSCWADGSGMNGGYTGMQLTKGDAIKLMLKDGFRVYNGDIEITL